jgi:hypothetical protein
MPKYAHNPSQPELLPEDGTADELTAEEQKEKEAYRQRLRAFLRDPEFHQIEGFPIGEDEDTLALSDPPYYTACPNPFLGEIIEEWQQERTRFREELTLPTESLDKGDGLKMYHREPFTSDVSEGKVDPIYRAHTYHTKVPHKAVMRYILHYTDPGDIVLDGFCGTGMTGVAAQLCGDKKTVESLGYTVQRDGTVLDANGETISKLGARKAVLVDLSPAATFIAYNYNIPVDPKAFYREARSILSEVEKECGWMYETWHPSCDDPNKVKGKINYTIWSDVYSCPQCGGEMVFWDVAMDKKGVQDRWNCPVCETRLSKIPRKNSRAQKVERVFETVFDRNLGKTYQQVKQVPVLINYTVGKDRFEKTPDSEDMAIIQRINGMEIPYPYPTAPIMFKGENWGDTWRAGYHSGITHIHHFYLKRSLWLIATIYSKINSDKRITQKPAISFLLQSLSLGYTKLNRYGATHYSQVNRFLSGTLYVSSIISEVSLRYAFDGKIRRLKKAFSLMKNQRGKFLITTQSASQLNIPKDSIDYSFVDPPFGSNLMYSELSFIWEAWLSVYTNQNNEAIVNSTQQKGLPEYQQIMETCFREFHKSLKPGRWLTIEFHNSQNSVWNSIQESVLRAGFMIADVRTLDKKQGSFKQVITTAAVKQDLIISAYKPRRAFERQFVDEGGSVQGAWAFIQQHLDQLPIPPVTDGIVETLTERQDYLLYDRMVAFHIMRGLAVPLSAAELYQGLDQRFLERDGMYFTPDQAAEYDKRRLGAQQVEQLSLFVSDEKSAIQWLRRELNPNAGTGPLTYQDLQPRFLRELHQARYEALPELREMLEDNFLEDQGGRWYVPNPEKQADLDALRQRSLLREFNEYLKDKGRLKVFRSEAVRVGFSHYWKERDYDTILKVADRLPSKVLEEDQQLLMYVHNAGLRQSQQPKQERLL